MSYEVYKVLHLSAIIGFFIIMAMSAADRKKTKFRVIVSGIALIVSLVAGFGLMARLGIARGMWPTWILLKFGIWGVLGMSGHILLKRAPHLLSKYMVGSFLLFVLAVLAANYKF